MKTTGRTKKILSSTQNAKEREEVDYNIEKV